MPDKGSRIKGRAVSQLRFMTLITHQPLRLLERKMSKLRQGLVHIPGYFDLTDTPLASRPLVGEGTDADYLQAQFPTASMRRYVKRKSKIHFCSSCYTVRG